MSNQRPSGFTLLELLVSSTLTAMLMIGLLTVLRSALQTTQHAEQLSHSNASTLLLNEQIDHDLRNARGIAQRNNELLLHGFLQRDGDAMANYQVAYVGYRIRPAGLVRWQSDSSAGQNTASEILVWAGATQLSVRFDGIDDEATASQSDLLLAGGLPIAPPSIEFLLMDASGRVISKRLISHHQDSLP